MSRRERERRRRMRESEREREERERSIEALLFFERGRGDLINGTYN